MGARPLRRAIQRYIEDPLADEVLKSSFEPGSTVEVDTSGVGEDGGDKTSAAEGEPEVRVSIKAPAREREAVGVGAKGGPSESGDDGEPESSSLPDEPEVLPDVPDAPPGPEEDPGHDEPKP